MYYTYLIILQEGFYCLPIISLHGCRDPTFLQERGENRPVIFSLSKSSENTGINLSSSHLSPRYIAIPFLNDLQQVRENAEGNTTNPLCLDEVGLRVKVMMHSNLDKIPGQLCPAGQQDLRDVAW